MNEKYIETYIRRFQRGICPLKARASEAFEVLGLDTETARGHVYLSGLYSERAGYLSLYGLGKEHSRFLVEVMFSQTRHKRVPIVVAVHNLAFDLASLLFSSLYSGPESSAPKESRFCHVPSRSEWFISWTRPCFAKIRKAHSTVHLIDTYAYFKTSLAEALKKIDAPVRKMEAPAGMKEGGQFTREEIEPYHRRDCEGAYWLGRKIVEMWKSHDVRPCVSIPHMAGSVFRRRFVTAPFVKLPKLVERASMLSYHGGKNRFLGEPGWKHRTYELDINSAYPEAMTHLPDFAYGTYKWVKEFLGPLGVYQVSGRMKPCRFGCLHSHEFKALQGAFSDVWVTGWELEEALRSHEITLSKCYGVLFIPEPGHLSPFRGYVEHFYKIKSEAKTKAEAEEPKLMQNSLYGKFIARRFNPEPGEPRIAGSMFYPFVGTLITGYVNAKIHRLEHKYNAFHTATDSIKTNYPPDPSDIGKELGKLKMEIFGDCLMLRNKLYVHRGYNGDIKVGLHGYQGDHHSLLALWKSGNFHYVKKRLTKWAEAWHSGAQPGSMTQRDMELFIDRQTRGAYA